MIPKSEVGVLSKDSKNVVELIKSAYNVSCQFLLHMNSLFFRKNCIPALCPIFFAIYFSLSHDTNMCKIHYRDFPPK